MSLINEKTSRKVKELLSARADFMLYRLPGRTPKLVTAFNPKVDVRIVPWNKQFREAVSLSEKTSKNSFELPESTPQQYYLDNVEAEISRLAGRGMAKTVVSRIIAGQTPDADWVEIADSLWQCYPDTFGYLFYTPSTGGWIGASPEKLLFTYSPDKFTTCALAGTLPVGVEWNRKNYEEQQMVATFIKEVLIDMGLSFEEVGPRSYNYGEIKHLLTTFSGTLTDVSTQTTALLDILAPTPALSGLPRCEAISDIEKIEKHSRQCYGGYIYLSEPTRMYSYVTIRCAQFNPETGQWAIYTGSGITPESNSLEEWHETAAKAKTLLSLLKKD